MLAMYAPEKPYVVYCIKCYESDKWDPLVYSREYNFSKSFFKQLDALMKVVPRRALYQDFATNSDYTNYAVYMKNSYLTFGGHHYEDCVYCSQNFYLTNCADVDFSMKSEQCYQSVHLRRCNRVFFSAYSEDCNDSWFLYGCRNCHDCIGCTNLRSAAYCIFNEQYSKEEYEKKTKELTLDSWAAVQKIAEEASKNSLRYPRKYAWTRNAINSTGDDLEQVKQCVYCFSATEDENCRYSFFVPTGAKETYDVDHVGLGTEYTYELHSGFGDSRVAFGNRIYYSHDIYYSDDCYNCAYLFGCVGLRKKEYCIFNKQYSKEEYTTMMQKIIEHMNAVPFKDTNGAFYKYGEYFPIAIIPFAYNETVAQEYFPITKEAAREHGFSWRDREERNYQLTLQPESIPDRMADIEDNILEQVVGCMHRGNCNEQCTTAFRIIPQELQFYRKFSIPLPRLCPNCRHFERLRLINPMSLSHGKCNCAGLSSKNGFYKNSVAHFHGQGLCPNEFETSYAPDRPEIVYCEQCYNSEVV